MNEMRRLNLAERSAAMKKVLSPISDTKIREKAWDRVRVVVIRVPNNLKFLKYERISHSAASESL